MKKKKKKYVWIVTTRTMGQFPINSSFQILNIYASRTKAMKEASRNIAREVERWELQ